VSSAITSGGGGGSVAAGSTISGATTTLDLLTLKTTDDNTTKDALRVVSSADAELMTVTPTGRVLAAAGTASLPGIGFLADDDGSGTGFYRVGADRLGVTIAGSNAYTFDDSTQVMVPNTDGVTILGGTSRQLKIVYAKGVQGANVKTLTESSATGFVTITVATSEIASGVIYYTVFAKDATNTQAKSGELFFSAAANSSGVVTAATVSDVNTLNPCTSGTLTNTMDSTTAANATTIRANAASSLTQTTLEIRYFIVALSGTFTVTAL
jgi:hypothetical protein